MPVSMPYLLSSRLGTATPTGSSVTQITLLRIGQHCCGLKEYRRIQTVIVHEDGNVITYLPTQQKFRRGTRGTYLSETDDWWICEGDRFAGFHYPPAIYHPLPKSVARQLRRLPSISASGPLPASRALLRPPPPRRLTVVGMDAELLGLRPCSKA